VKSGYRIIDSDLHVMEPDHFLIDYLQEPYRSKTKVYNNAPPGKVNQMVYELGGEVYRGRPGYGGDGGAIQKLKERRPPPNAFRDLDVNDLLKGMDAEGLDVAVVFPTHGFGIMTIAAEKLDVDYGSALASAYNNWMRDFCSADPKRLKPTSVVNLSDPVQAAAEARRAVEELGAVSIVSTVNVVNDHQPHDPFYDPLWHELNRLGAPICFHPTTYRPKEGTFPRFNAQPDISGTIAHAITNPSYQMMNVGSFTVGGVFERFPNLRVGFLETSASWAAWLLWRLDDHWEMFGPDEGWTLSMKPSDYFRRQGWVAMEPEEQTAKYLIDFAGDNNIVISTDFPHPDSIWPNAMDEFIELDALSEQAKRKILWDNSTRLYNLDPETAENQRTLSPRTV